MKRDQSTPFKIKFLKFFGIDSLIHNNFLFNPKHSTYSFISENAKLIISPKKQSNKFLIPQFEQNDNYDCYLIEGKNFSIPIIHIKNRILEKKPRDQHQCMIYSHGKTTDILQSLRFSFYFNVKYTTDVIIYDYSGYGQSRYKGLINSQTFTNDLEQVLAFSINFLQYKQLILTSLGQIIIGGYSIGTVPSINMSSKYSVNSTFLIAPIASFNSLICSDVQSYKDDSLSSIQKMGKIRSQVFIVHSVDDEIVGINNSRILVQAYIQKKGQKNLWYLQVGKLKHTEMHKQIIKNQNNFINIQLHRFMLISHYKMRNQKITWTKNMIFTLQNAYKEIQNRPLQQQENINDIASQMSLKPILISFTKSQLKTERSLNLKF